MSLEFFSELIKRNDPLFKNSIQGFGSYNIGNIFEAAFKLRNREYIDLVLPLVSTYYYDLSFIEDDLELFEYVVAHKNNPFSLERLIRMGNVELIHIFSKYHNCPIHLLPVSMLPELMNKGLLHIEHFVFSRTCQHRLNRLYHYRRKKQAIIWQEFNHLNIPLMDIKNTVGIINSYVAFDAPDNAVKGLLERFLEFFEDSD